MKITITPTGTSTAFVLGDDSAATTVFTGSSVAAFANGLGGAIVDGFRPKTLFSVQKTPRFRSDAMFVNAQFNALTSISFLVGRSFATAQVCGLFIDSHPDAIPVTGFWTTTHVTELGSLKLYRPAAFLEKVECVLHQQEYCQFRYDFTFNAPVQTTAPS